MAIVGEAHIIVKAITSGVERDIRNGFQNVEGAGTDAGKRLGSSYGNGFWAGYNSSRGSKVFDKIRDGLKALDGDAERSVQTFQRLVTANYFVSGAFGVLAGTIGQAVVGLGALAAAGAGAAASVVAVGSAAISARIGLSTIGFAMKGISQAVNQATAANRANKKSMEDLKFEAEELAISEERAALNVEKAAEAVARTRDLPPNSRARREADQNLREAEFRLRKIRADQKKVGQDMDSGGGGADPYAGLTPAQKDFAKYLVSIKSKLDELREEVAKGFLPKLKIAIDSMLKSTFPTFKAGLAEIASAMGDAAIAFADAFDSDQVQLDLRNFFSNVAKNVKPLGDIFSAISIGLVRFLNASQPLTERFIKWVNDVADGFERWTLREAESITDFLNRSGDAASILGDVFKNVFNGLGDIINENLKPGSGGYNLLQWLKAATFDFARIGESEGFSEVFKEAAKGTKALLQVIGKIIGFFLQFAADPNVTKFWETIRDGFPSMEKVVEAISKALPSIAEFINEIGGILAALAENDGLKIFFDTLTSIAKGAKDVIKALAPVLAFLAPILAIITAFRLFGKILKFLGLVGLGLTNRFKTFLTTLRNTFGFFSKANKDAKKGQKEVGDSVDRTEKNVKRMNRAVTATEKAFRGMNTAIASVNKTLTAFKERIRSAEGPLGRLKKSAKETTAQIRGVRTEGDKAASKLTRIKTESDRAQKSLDKVKRAAKEARSELKLLGNTKSAPTVGGATGTSGGGGTTVIAGGRGMGGLLKSPLGIGSVAAIAGGAISQTIAPIIDQSNAAKAATVQLSILAKANGGLGKVSDEVAKKLVDLAYEQSVVTGISVDQFFAVEKLLMKYPNLAKSAGITGGAFQTLVKKSADVATVLGVDATTAAQLMADALKDPKTALQNLTDQGIIFTDSEKKKYDSILKTNGAADAQKFLLDQIGAKYDGVAKKSASSSAVAEAAWQKTTKRIGDVLAPIGRFFDQFSTALADLVFILFGGDPKLSAKQKALADKVKTNLNNSNYSGGVMVPNATKSGNPFLKNGGYVNVRRYAPGGYVKGPGTGTSDSIAAMISNGEYVVNARATSQNRALLEAINSNQKISTAPNVSITINPSAGMDERELAAIVSRQLAFEIRKGGY